MTPKKITAQAARKKPAVSKPKKVKKLTRGQRVIAFIERYCIIPEGEHIGKPMRLEPFQKEFILDVYDNPHGTHTGVLSIARKNGKTGLIAAILLCHLVGPEAVQNSQIVSGAMSKEQAAVVFELSVKMVELSDSLRPLVKIFPSGKRLLGLARNVLYRALAAEGKTAHGLSPILAIIDEMGQIVGPTDKFIAAIETAQGAYKNPLMLVISTQAPTDADMLSLIIDAQIDPLNTPNPKIVVHLHAAQLTRTDPNTGLEVEIPLDDKASQLAANPAMGVFRDADDVAKQCTKAIAIPSFEPEYRNLILNQRVEASSPFVPRSVWESNGAPPDIKKGDKVWGGLDLSSVNDLTCALIVGERGGVLPTFWLPAHGLREKAARDKVTYDIWEKQGFLLTTPGKAIEYEFVAQFLRTIFDDYDVQAFGFDRYNMKFLKPWLAKAGFSQEEIDKFIEFGQGTASMTPALRDLEVKLLNGQLQHGKNPVLNMCSANAKVVGDSGARKFDKRTARGRIDGMVALAIAIGVMPQEAGDSGGSLDEYLNDMAVPA